MVDDSIDVDKLLIRTWHTLPADLGEGTGVTQGSSHNVGRRADMSGRGFGFEEDETYFRHIDQVIRVVDLNSLDIDRGLRLFIVMDDIVQTVALWHLEERWSHFEQGKGDS